MSITQRRIASHSTYLSLLVAASRPTRNPRTPLTLSVCCLLSSLLSSLCSSLCFLLYESIETYAQPSYVSLSVALCLCSHLSDLLSLLSIPLDIHHVGHTHTLGITASTATSTTLKPIWAASGPVCCLLSAVCCLLAAVYCPLSAVCCLLSVCPSTYT